MGVVHCTCTFITLYHILLPGAHEPPSAAHALLLHNVLRTCRSAIKAMKNLCTSPKGLSTYSAHVAYGQLDSLINGTRLPSKLFSAT